MITSYFLKPKYPVGITFDPLTFDQYFIASNQINEAKKALQAGQPVFPGTICFDESYTALPFVDSIDSFWFHMLTALETLQNEPRTFFSLVYQPYLYQLNKEEHLLSLQIVLDSNTSPSYTFCASMNRWLQSMEGFFQDCHEIGLAIVEVEFKEVMARIARLKKKIE